MTKLIGHDALRKKLVTTRSAWCITYDSPTASPELKYVVAYACDLAPLLVSYCSVWGMLNIIVSMLDI